MKKYLVTGLIILLPILITIFLLVFLLDLLTDPFVAVIVYFLERAHSSLINFPELITFASRILVLILLFIFTCLLGFFARRFFVKGIMNFTNTFFLKIPVIRSIYKVSKEVIASLFSPDGKKVFKKAVLIPFPSDRSFAIGYVTGEVPEICLQKTKKELVAVLVLTAPHPISGFLVMIEKDKIKEIDMSNEEAIKFIVSCGVVMPDET